MNRFTDSILKRLDGYSASNPMTYNPDGEYVKIVQLIEVLDDIFSDMEDDFAGWLHLNGWSLDTQYGDWINMGKGTFASTEGLYCKWFKYKVKKYKNENSKNRT